MLIESINLLFLLECTVISSSEFTLNFNPFQFCLQTPLHFTVTMKFLEAMKYQIRFQQFLLIAPYRVVKNRAESSGVLNLYIVIMVSGFFLNIVIATHLISSENSGNFGFNKGYLWRIIGIFELTFANVSYPLLVIHTLIYRRHQIDFLNKICDIDETLNEQFGVDTNRLNDYQRWRSYIFIVGSSTYYLTLYYLVFFHLLPSAVATQTGYLLLVVANQMEQCSMGLLTWTIIYYCSVIRQRCTMLQSIKMADIIRSEDVKKSRKLMATWLAVFRDLCRLIEGMNNGWGFVIAWRYSHDFTLLISQLYLMYFIVELGGHSTIFLFVLYWSIQNVFKLFGMGLSADMATRKVYIELRLIGLK